MPGYFAPSDPLNIATAQMVLTAKKKYGNSFGTQVAVPGTDVDAK